MTSICVAKSITIPVFLFKHSLNNYRTKMKACINSMQRMHNNIPTTQYFVVVYVYVKITSHQGINTINIRKDVLIKALQIDYSLMMIKKLF